MTEATHLRDILIVLLAAVAVVPVFRRLGASAVLGYLIAGALIGPSGLDLVDVSGTTVLAQFGVVFLLFSLGLELSVDRLIQLRRYVFGLGTAQVIATTLLLWLLLHALGLGQGPALVLGSGLALSSTAVVMQMLVEHCERLIAAGATAVVPELVEGSLQLDGTLLRHLGSSGEEVEQILHGFRRQAYSRMNELLDDGAKPR